MDEAVQLNLCLLVTTMYQIYSLSIECYLSQRVLIVIALIAQVEYSSNYLLSLLL